VVAVRILIEPNDVLLFRELKHFTAGEDHIARSTLPLPQTVAGAIRSKILVSQNFSQEAKDYIGYEKDEPEGNDVLKIIGTFLWDEGELFATPMDVAAGENLCYMEPKRIDEFEIEFFHPPAEPRGGLIKINDLAKYLVGELELDRLKIESVVREGRIGVGLNPAKTAEEHMLYSVEFIRIKAISVWVENLKHLPEAGLLKLGGEGRFARFRVGENESIRILERSWEKVRNEIGKRAKLYVATPLLIENSGRFTWNVEMELKKAGFKIERITPLIGKPLKISGWNRAKNWPKGVRYAIPAGSVYFIEFEGELNIERPYLKLGELTNLGYGLCFLGVWP
jgi:CRISPR-associated protein Cmr3